MDSDEEGHGFLLRRGGAAAARVDDGERRGGADAGECGEERRRVMVGQTVRGAQRGGAVRANGASAANGGVVSFSFSLGEILSSL